MVCNNSFTTKNNSGSLVRQIRIIGGRWRGQKISVLNIPGLRPTKNYIRETLFNWLIPVINGSHCLDCFSGSGALGIEALSRNAFSVTLLEKNRMIIAQLIRNLQKLHTNQARVINTDTLNWIKQLGNVFNIVFIDPPFYHDLINQTVNALEKHHRLTNNAWIYIETEIGNSALKIPINWKLHRKKTAGHVSYRLYIRNAMQYLSK